MLVDLLITSLVGGFVGFVAYWIWTWLVDYIKRRMNPEVKGELFTVRQMPADVRQVESDILGRQSPSLLHSEDVYWAVRVDFGGCPSLVKESGAPALFEHRLQAVEACQKLKDCAGVDCSVIQVTADFNQIEVPF